jgi:hypothetical protein
MIAFIAFLFFFISITATVCLAKIKFNNFLRVPLLIFFVILLIISTFLGIITVDVYKIDRGAQLFIHDFIADPNKGNLPPFSYETTQEEKVRIENIIAGLPEKDYKIQIYDRFGDLWEYHIQFENGDTYFCAVEAPGTFLTLTLFARVKYKLYSFREIEKMQGKECENK